MSNDEDPQKAIDAGGGYLPLRPSNLFSRYDPAKDSPAGGSCPPGKPNCLQVSPAMNSLDSSGGAGRTGGGPGSVDPGRSCGPRGSAVLEWVAAWSTMIGEAQRIEALPFPVARANLSLLDQARHCDQAGNYAAAMIYLFSHQLVQNLHLCPPGHSPGEKPKRSRKIPGEVGQAEMLRQLVGQTVVAFEDVFLASTRSIASVSRHVGPACRSSNCSAEGPPSAA